MQPNQLFALALVLAATGLLLLAGLLIARLAAARRSARTLAHALDERALHSAAAASKGAHAAAAWNASPSLLSSPSRGTVPAGIRQRGMQGFLERCANAGTRWLDTPVGRQFVAHEDRRLLEQCGFVDARARGLFLIARVAGAVVLPLVAGTLAHAQVQGPRYVLAVIVAFVCGVMAPKVVLRRRAAARRAAVVDELPMLVDLLRLLQGVGLSLDQSLQVMVNDFRGVLPVLSGELEIAQRQFAAGRTREQSLARLASSFDNEDLRAVVRLLIQVDRHGGAVQEPLKQFGDRLRETRRAMLRERIGRMAVKMTGVMILTLLPALMIVTAGPGVLSVSHSLKTMHR
ncbi:type II secretion system F family protein [Paraburkholderia phenoliruptrix]|uniref:type II secretion system F family protein n=1 Tax=Paraburkholderia phenoliruptrix TaxID=252970 RepID=UPI001C6EDD48|nr:type II secretion system F family protein [Paraburkholderia phenoliruptrix]MBW9106697.1 type II secretion system F family protein [Paraburkholderia phenoliruptrix]MBW9132569.1 type II secretion system F family protein [Paraburkholderia ginsengiterrae]